MFVAGPYMTITCEVYIAGGYALAYTCKHVESICPSTKMPVWLIFAMWQPYLFSNIKYVYSDIGVNLVCRPEYICTLIYTDIHMQTCVHLAMFIPNCIHSYMHAHTYMSTYVYIYASTHTYMNAYTH